MAAYLVAICDITDYTDGLWEYHHKSEAYIKELNGKYLFRGKIDKVYEGDYLKDKLFIIVEFDSEETLAKFRESDYYCNEVMPLREGTGTFEMARVPVAPSSD